MNNCLIKELSLKHIYLISNINLTCTITLYRPPIHQRTTILIVVVREVVVVVVVAMVVVVVAMVVVVVAKATVARVSSVGP